MIREGQIVLFRFPQADTGAGKLRPALVVRQLPGEFNDWLISMISSQLRHEVSGFDEIIDSKDTDFEMSGLRTSSVVRIGRLAVVEGSLLLGAIGLVDADRLQRIKNRLADWLLPR